MSFFAWIDQEKTPVTHDEWIAVKELLHEARCMEIKKRREANVLAEKCQKAEMEYAAQCDRVRHFEKYVEDLNNERTRIG